MIYAFIPVRGGSKSIPLKNIKKIAGKPLVQWVIDAAKGVREIDNIVVSTDSIDIYKCVRERNQEVSIIGRSKESASDTAPSELPLIEFCEGLNDDDIVVFIQATSPLLKSKEIEEGIHKIISGQYDSCLSVVRQKRFIWSEDGIPNYDIKKRPRRQEYDGILVENGAFYISKAADIVKNNCRISGHIGLVECSEESYFEIDEISDFTIVEQIVKNNSYFF